MKRIAVAGFPVSHSLSPVIFNSLLEKYNNDSHYTRITGSSFEEIIQLAEFLNVSALNVTAPFKHNAFKFTSQNDENSQLTETVNFLEKVNGNYIGKNTDIFALESIIREINPSKDSKFLILGNGDTAFLTYKTLIKKGFKNISIAARNKKDTNGINFNSSIKFININDLQPLLSYDVLINTIPESDFDFKKIDDNPNLVIIDAIYKKPFLNIMNCRYIDGFKWLSLQAVPAIEKIFDIPVNETEINEYLKNYKSLKKNIVLTGFMASGKSTVGKKLSKELGLNFVDTDTEIEKKMGISVSEIFSKYGEEYFRNLEYELVHELLKQENLIVALGGGTVFNKKLTDFIKSNFYVIYLFTTFSEILNRLALSDSKRPLAKTENLELLFRNREEGYFIASDLIINNSNDLDSTLKILKHEIRSTFKY